MPRLQTDNDGQRARASGTKAEKAAERAPIGEERHIEEPHARKARTPLREGEKHDHLAERERATRNRQEALLDEAIEETFPGSDPISPKHIT
jgi:hypothetical protein